MIVFSKSVHYVALEKLPSTQETTDLLVQPVFRIHGTSKILCRTEGLSSYLMSGRVSVRQTLEAKVSLSSGFHHQTNGQCERANHNLEVSFRCPSGAWPPRTSRTGAYSFPGWNMRITRCHLLLPVCLPLYVPLVTYRRYFLSRREMWGFRQ